MPAPFLPRDQGPLKFPFFSKIPLIFFSKHRLTRRGGFGEEKIRLEKINCFGHLLGYCIAAHAFCVQLRCIPGHVQMTKMWSTIVMNEGI